MRHLVKPLLAVGSRRVMARRCKSLPSHLRDSAVSSVALDQIDQKCERIRPIKPRVNKVTVIGAATDVGLITCLFLKQHSVIGTIAMYEDFPHACGVIGHANDLAHIDTSSYVEAYQGKTTLADALRDTQVVLICGGAYACAPYYRVSDYDMFNANATYIRCHASAIAQYAPNAIVCVQTPPVDANFNVVRHTLKKFHVYDKRKLMGVNSITAMRGNQLYCALADLDPTKSFCPCIGGTVRCARVPVFSVMDKYQSMSPGQIDVISRLVRQADDLICKVKNSTERAHLSIGFSTARFIISTMLGLWKGKGSIDSALVEQSSPNSCYGMKICASPVTMGYTGIDSYSIPKLNPKEAAMLEHSRLCLDDMLYLGRCFVRGDDYNPPCCCPYFLLPDCPQAVQHQKTPKRCNWKKMTFDQWHLSNCSLKKHN